jgi:hypothetical protein
MLTSIAVVLGKQWKQESQHVKAHFQALAEEIKRKHAEAYPNYQYSPRKSTEKKRRTVTPRQPPCRPSELISIPQITSPIEFTTEPPVEQSIRKVMPIRIDSIPFQDFDSHMESQLSDFFLEEMIDYENIEFNEEEFESMIQQAESAQDRAALFEEIAIIPASTTDPNDWMNFIM